MVTTNNGKYKWKCWLWASHPDPFISRPLCRLPSTQPNESYAPFAHCSFLIFACDKTACAGTSLLHKVIA